VVIRQLAPVSFEMMGKAQLRTGYTGGKKVRRSSGRGAISSHFFRAATAQHRSSSSNPRASERVRQHAHCLLQLSSQRAASSFVARSRGREQQKIATYPLSFSLSRRPRPGAQSGALRIAAM
jgi:hypothetical protein